MWETIIPNCVEIVIGVIPPPVYIGVRRNSHFVYDFGIVVAPPPTNIYWGEVAWPLYVGIGIIDAFPSAYIGVRRRGRLCENGY